MEEQVKKLIGSADEFLDFRDRSQEMSRIILEAIDSHYKGEVRLKHVAVILSGLSDNMMKLILFADLDKKFVDHLFESLRKTYFMVKAQMDAEKEEK
jgi:hypothetical protein